MVFKRNILKRYLKGIFKRYLKLYFVFIGGLFCICFVSFVFVLCQFF